ncbi:MAG: hypothetical protein HZC12_07875 [Nitrospirae bacterium]|nr:hypothetical protein [Nitrospirota bacterium]
MKEIRKDMVSMGTKVGAVIGGIVFIVFGIIPGFYFGSYATLIILNKLFGGPLKAGVLVNVLVAIGIILGIFCIGAASIVIGAIIGTGIGYLIEFFTAQKKR